MQEYTKPIEEIIQVKYEGKTYNVSVEKILNMFDNDNDGTAVDNIAKLITGKKWMNLVKYVTLYRAKHPLTITKLTKPEIFETLEYLDPLEVVWRALRNMENGTRCQCCLSYRNTGFINTPVYGVNVCNSCDMVLPDDENYRAGIAKILEKNVFPVEV